MYQRDRRSECDRPLHELRELPVIGRMAMWAVVGIAMLIATCSGFYCLGISGRASQPVRRAEKAEVPPPSIEEKNNAVLDREIDADYGQATGDRVRDFVAKNVKVSVFTAVQQKAAFLLLKRHGVEDKRAALAMMGAEDLAVVAPLDRRDAVYGASLVAFARIHDTGKLDAASFATIGIRSKSRPIGENDFLNLIVRTTGEKALGQRGVEAHDRTIGRAN